ncbi:MAG: glycosyltransferase family 39 protein [Saprospiraceae bacterium]|nr:glycosyltransferase family 39 protein [Saprospiraceae bacterium]
MKILNSKLTYPFLLVIISLLFFVPYLGGVHLFDWDEINFAEISREMLVLNDYLRVHVNFKAFYEKPPFFFWLQCVSMSIFGINEFAARFPNAICGLITLLVLYSIGKKLFSARFGWLWTLSYFGSILPFLYFKSGIIDPWFNLFTFLALYFLIKVCTPEPGTDSQFLPFQPFRNILWAGCFSGLAILTKGPAALIIITLCILTYWLYHRFRTIISFKYLFLFFIISTFFPLLWFGLETLLNGPQFIFEFFKYQFRLFSTPDAGHAGFPGYHIVVLLFGVFPASVFCIKAFLYKDRDENVGQKHFKKWMFVLLIVVLILFSIVQSKIVHYSSLCYFPITFLSAYTLDKLLDQKMQWNKMLVYGLSGMLMIYSIVVIALPVVGMDLDLIKSMFSKDPFALANLEADVKWSFVNFLPGIFLALLFMWFILNASSFVQFYKVNVFFIGMACFSLLALIFTIQNIEGYSQNAAISFYKEKSAEDCYILPYGFKTYGHLFYAQKRRPNHPEYYQQNWLLNGSTDKPVYVVSKIHKAEELNALTQLQELYRLNGFVFYKRVR